MMTTHIDRPKGSYYDEFTGEWRVPPRGERPFDSLYQAEMGRVPRLSPGEVVPLHPPELTPAPVKSLYDEAREQIAQWEREYPDAARVALVLDAKDIVLTVTGPAVKPSDAAGLFFAAAQLSLED